MNVIHTAIWVSDLEASLEFYTEVLDLDHRWNFGGEDGRNNVYVGGEEGAEIQLKRADDDREIDPDDVAFDHLAVTVEDVDEAFERIVEESGFDVRDEPFDNTEAGARVAFIRDPDGYAVELVQPKEF